MLFFMIIKAVFLFTLQEMLHSRLQIQAQKDIAMKLFFHSRFGHFRQFTLQSV